MARPLLAITMGDPAGIGPEVVLKALADPQLYALCRPLVVGSAAMLQRTLRWTPVALTIRPVATPEAAEGQPGVVEVLDLANVDAEHLPLGQVSAEAGRAAMEYVLQAYELARAGRVAGMVTAPISKEATSLAGYPDMGHMALFERLTGITEQATMLVSGALRVVHLTTHYSLAEACRLVTRERVLRQLRLTHRSFETWGWQRPTIAVAALNPHAGEGGLLGREEIEAIAPAVADARAEGIDAQGPYPADSLFARAVKGLYAAVLAMYHDQGHIAIKVHGFERSVSVALGFPFLRTSVDHGTAFDIAGQGVADAQSMAEAIRVAATLAAGRPLAATAGA
ncbi:MAG TPA: 4-hydroxythreonine-4-phosphate dehydrogenase PdxA [Chloroflexota bacterium]|nr:4-hydroxythreonine-4-phosphate dehydrogenase PdxA [Chloroflexota bacterium]